MIFGILTLVKGIRYWQDPDRKLKERIIQDARTWEVRVPESFQIRKKIFRIYKRIQKKEKREPIFITSFSSILNEFWQNAGAFERESEWLESLGYLERNIPKLNPSKVGLSEALSEMQNLNLELEKATVEVRNF